MKRERNDELTLILGDPIEAEAIHNAFFGDRVQVEKVEKTRPALGPLFVGSIKTVIGHTEGTAGLAALLKASLSLQHRVVPPNRLFDRLNPKIRPYYGDLEILTEARAWPALPPGTVARASVNSFGFGGANAHCTYTPFTFHPSYAYDARSV